MLKSLTHVRLFVTQWTTAHQASLSFTISQSLQKLMSTESMKPSNHLVPCCPFFLLPSIFPSIRVFSNESALCIRWPKYSDSASACAADWRMNSNSSISAHVPSPSLLVEARLPGRKWYKGKWSLSLTRVPEECGGRGQEKYTHPSSYNCDTSNPLSDDSGLTDSSKLGSQYKFMLFPGSVLFPLKFVQVSFSSSISVSVLSADSFSVQFSCV